MRPLKVSSRQMGRRLGVLLPPLGFARNSRLAALQVLLTAILAASLPRSGDAAWPRPSYSDAARRVSGPSPLDLGDAAARHARASADAATAPDLSPAARPRRVEPPHAGWGARRGHAPRPGTPFTRDEDDALSASRRRLLDDSGDARALGELAWTSLADVPSRLRCSGCDLTLRALHAESALAARRLVPPSWLATSPGARETLIARSWTRACAAVASLGPGGVIIVDGAFEPAVGSFVESAWLRATEAATGVAAGDGVEGDRNRGSPDRSATSAAKGAVYVCALLRADARAKMHLTGVVAGSGVHPFTDAEVADACETVTGTDACRGKRERDEF